MKFNELTTEQQLLEKEILNQFIQNRFDDIYIDGRMQSEERIKCLMNKEYILNDTYLFIGKGDGDANEMCFHITIKLNWHKKWPEITMYIEETKWIEQSRDYKLEKLLSNELM